MIIIVLKKLLIKVLFKTNCLFNFIYKDKYFVRCNCFYSRILSSLKCPMYIGNIAAHFNKHSCFYLLGYTCFSMIAGKIGLTEPHSMRRGGCVISQQSVTQPLHLAKYNEILFKQFLLKKVPRKTKVMSLQ